MSYPTFASLRKAAIVFAQEMQEVNRYDFYDDTMAFMYNYCVVDDNDDMSTEGLDDAVDAFVRLKKTYQKSREGMRETPLFVSKTDEAFAKEYRKT